MESVELRKLAAECRLIGKFIPNLQSRVKLNNEGKITRLDLSSVHLDEFSHFPVSILGFDNLTHLSLRNNDLVKVPEALGELPQLQRLDLAQNCITDITALHEMTQLQSLNLRDNQLTSIDQISFQQLNKLDLSYNYLESIPPEILAEQLQQLYLAYNEIQQFENKILKLDQLTYLNLRANQISDVPEELFEMCKLRKLNLYSNPLDLGNIDLSQNQSIHLFVDNHTSIPNDQYDRITVLTPRICDFRFDPGHPPQFGISHKGVPLTSVLLFGEDGVGKRSLLENYIHEHFIPEDNLTIEQNRYLNWDHYIMQKRQHKFQFWFPHTQNPIDPSYNTSVLNGFYYADAIVLVFDLSNKYSFQKISGYLRRILQVRTTICPVVIVGNKADRGARVVSKDQINKVLEKGEELLGLNIPYIETSVIKNWNIEQVFSTVFNFYDVK